MCKVPPGWREDFCEKPPLRLALIISCLYNIVDQIFVGNGIGYLGNAATGIVFPITVIGWGASVLFGDSIFYALGATEATIGLTRYSMAAMIVSAVINMIGDPVAIFVLGWGIKGAAYATILGQFVSFLICVAYLWKSRVFRVKPADFRPRWSYLKPVLPLGAGSFLTQLCIVITTIVNNVLLKSYGAQSPYGSDIPLSAFVIFRVWKGLSTEETLAQGVKWNRERLA